MKEKVAVSVTAALILASLCFAEAQQTAKTTPRIGFIFPAGAPGTSSALFDAFQQGLRDLGYVPGENVLIERRYAERTRSDAHVRARVRTAESRCHRGDQ